MNAIKYFTEIYSFKHDIIPNYYQLVQACSNINILCFDKRKYEVSKNKHMLDKRDFNGVISNTLSQIHNKLDKEEVNRLKQVADIKIKNKIDTVEMIDSLILSSNK